MSISVPEERREITFLSRKANQLKDLTNKGKRHLSFAFVLNTVIKRQKKGEENKGILKL